MIKKVTWFVFILLAVFMSFQAHVLKYSTCPRYSMVQLETACKAKGRAILKAWNSKCYGEGSMLDLARSNTYWDDFFILLYVTLIVTESNDRMQQEKWMPLNALLRLNLFLAFLAGMFDICENTMLLHNFRHVGDGRYYLVTCWATYPKFIFACWAVLVWAISLIKSALLAVFTKQRHPIAIPG